MSRIMLKTTPLINPILIDDKLKYCKNVYKYCRQLSTASQENRKISEFESVINSEKLKAKNYFIIQDKCNVLTKLNEDNVSQLLETKVERIFKWIFNNNNCALVELKDKNYLLRQETRRNLGYEPRKSLVSINNSRFISLNTCPKFLSNKRTARSSGDQNGSIEKLSKKRDVFLNVDYLRQMSKTNDELLRFLLDDKYISNLDLKLRYYIINQLETFICQSFFKDYRILPFGSTIAGLGSAYSDLDMVMIPNILRQESSKYEDRQMIISNLSLIADLLQGSVPFYSRFTRILKARIPIIKFSFDLAPLEIDLSTELSPHSVHHGVSMSAFINYCLQLNPQIKDLINLLKIWANQHKLVKPRNWLPHIVYNGFTSFQLTALVLFFLQKKALIPPMKYFLNDEPFEPSNKNINVIQLLSEFFEFVIVQPFDWEALSILHAIVFENPDNAPIYMENPFDLGRNMCQSVIKSKFEKFLELSAISAGIMRSQHFCLADILDSDLSNINRNKNNNRRIIVQDLFSE